MRFLYSSFLLPVLLFTLLTGVTHAQPIPRAEADSLLKLLQAGKVDTNRVNQLIRLGEYQVYKPGEFKADMDWARSYVQHAQALSRQLKYYQGEGRSLNLLGTISREAKELEQSLGYHQAALQLYRQHGDWKGEADTYLRLAWTRRDKGDAGGARKEIHKAIALYRGKGDRRGVGEAYIELGNTYADWGEAINTKMGYYQQALQWFARANDKKRQADVHKDLGDLYGIQGSDAKALLELHKALALYRSIHYHQLQGVYDLLGHISSGLGDYEEGLKYGLRAVQTAERVKDSTLQLCTIYNRLGITYYNLKQNRKAYLYFNKAMVVAQKYNDQPSILTLTSNIASVLSRLGQPKEAIRLLLSTAKRYPPENVRDSILLDTRLIYNYTKLKQYVIAQRYCNQLLSLADQLGKHHTDRIYIYSGIIPFYTASNQHRQAQKYLVEYEAFSRGTNNLKATSDTQLYRFQLDSMQGNYHSAIRYYQRYKMLQDSLLNETKNQQLASLEVLYETQKKEQDLKLKDQSIKALTRERLLQDQKLRQDQIVRNAVIGLAGMLLLLLALGYNRYRLKQRSNRLLKAQQEQINQQNDHLSVLLTEKDTLLGEKEELLQEKDSLLFLKDSLIGEKEGLLQEKDTLLEEKEQLLKEIHHRVKNNLQIVMSLLNSQAASLADKAALSAIRESQHRVQAMALIHQKLYQSQGLARISMPDYVTELISYLRDSYRLSQPIRFHLQVDPLELDVTQAVPLGLILNEAVTNACKYAFADGRAGTVSVSLKQLPGVQPATYQLRIEDDGVGLPQGFNPARSRSLGMTLLHGFSRQLKGKLSLGGPPGLSISLAFAEEKLPAAALAKAAPEEHAPSLLSGVSAATAAR